MFPFFFRGGAISKNKCKMDIGKFVTELNARTFSRDAVAVKTFAVGFYGRYIVEINENNIVLIRRKTDEQLLKENAKTEKESSLCKNGDLDPFLFTNTEEVLYFDLTQCMDKTAESLIEEMKVGKYADELKPILTDILEAYNKANAK